MATATFVARNASANWDRGAHLIDKPCGEAAGVGLMRVVQLEADGEFVLSDADGAAGIQTSVGILIASTRDGEVTVPLGVWGTIVTFGETYGWTGLTPGATYYVGTTAGELVDTPPANAYPMGYAIDAQTFFVRPGATGIIS